MKEEEEESGGAAAAPARETEEGERDGGRGGEGEPSVVCVYVSRGARRAVCGALSVAGGWLERGKERGRGAPCPADASPLERAAREPPWPPMYPRRQMMGGKGEAKREERWWAQAYGGGA